jgi:hypothetical protein
MYKSYPSICIPFSWLQDLTMAHCSLFLLPYTFHSVKFMAISMPANSKNRTILKEIHNDRNDTKGSVNNLKLHHYILMAKRGSIHLLSHTSS